jgi:hypothetical protein
MRLVETESQATIDLLNPSSLTEINAHSLWPTSEMSRASSLPISAVVARIDKILSSAEQTVSTAVFQTWMRRFEFCRENERKDLL